jgi:hypothetical protein
MSLFVAFISLLKSVDYLLNAAKEPSRALPNVVVRGCPFRDVGSDDFPVAANISSSTLTAALQRASTSVLGCE